MAGEERDDRCITKPPELKLWVMKTQTRVENWDSSSGNGMLGIHSKMSSLTVASGEDSEVDPVRAFDG